MKNKLIVFPITIVFLLCFVLTGGAEEREIFAELWGYRIYHENGQYGLMDENENVIVQATYDLITPYDKTYVKTEAFCLQEEGKNGVAIVTDRDLKLIPAVYEKTLFGEDQRWYCTQGEYRCILNQWGEELVPLLGSAANTISDGICVLSYQTPCSYYLIDEKRQIVTEWDAIQDFGDSLAPVKKNGLWGYIDSDNQEVIQCQYSDAWPFQNGMAWVADEDGNYGAIDLEGNLQFVLEDLFPETYFSEFGTAFVSAENGEIYHLVDRTGEFIDETGWGMEYAEPDGNGYFLAQTKDYCWGVINWKGETVVPFETVMDAERNLLIYQEGLCISSLGYDECEEEYRFRIYNYDGKMLCEFGTESCYVPESFSEGLSLISERDQNYFVDQNGHVVLKVGEGYRCADSNGSFSEGLSCIIFQEKYGYMNHQGEIVIPIQYRHAYAFHNGVAKVTTEQGETGYINHKGEYVLLLKK